VDMLQFSCLQYIFVTIFALVPAVLLEPFPTGWDGSMYFALGYCGIASTLLAMTMMNIGIRYASPNYASLLMSTESAFGCLFGVIFLHEALNARMSAGCVLILAALLISQLQHKPKRAEVR
ncbi:MAG: DMT family transporter, partial [Clostridia bacterium]|nr:DMT family transporter [Clostridia bacterium]